MTISVISDFRRIIASMWKNGEGKDPNTVITDEEFRSLVNPVLTTINRQLFGGKGKTYQKDDIFGITVHIDNTDYYLEIRNLFGCRHFELYLMWIDSGKKYVYIIGNRRRAKNIDNGHFKKFDVGICSMRRKTKTETELMSYFMELLKYSPEELGQYLASS